MEGMSSTDMEVLKKQREELLLKKQAKERVLAELIPENVEVLKQQRELILAKKAEKERQLVELMNKQEIVSNRATGGTLSKSNSKKRGRSKRDDEDELASSNKQSTLSTSSSLFNTETKFILDDKQFDELRKEHKRNRKLIREQYQEFEVLTQYTLNRVDYLQQSLNLIMNHLGLVPVLPTQPEPVKQVDNIQKEDISIEVEVHTPSPAISSLTQQQTQIESVPTESLTVPIIEVIEAHTTDMIVESIPEIITTDNQVHEQTHLEHQQEQQPTENNNNNNNNSNNNNNRDNNNNNNNDTYNYNNNDNNNMMEVVKERAHSESSASDTNNNFNIHQGEEKYMNEEENKKMMMFNNEGKQENGIRNNCYSESFSATTEYTNDQHHF